MNTDQTLGFDASILRARLESDKEWRNNYRDTSPFEQELNDTIKEIESTAKRLAMLKVKKKVMTKKLSASRAVMRRRQQHISTIYIAELQLKQRRELMKSLSINKHDTKP